MALPISSMGQQLQKFEFEAAHMGTTFRLVFYADSDSLAGLAADNAFQKIASLNAIFSDYEKESELNRISRQSGSTDWISISSPLYNILRTSRKLSERTKGAFDITVGPYVKLWRNLKHTNDPQLPTPDTLSRLSKSVGYRYLKLHEERQAVQLLKADMQLDLGGIAKGFAADKVLQTLQRHGIYSAFVDAGGDITVGDAPPQKEGWQIGVQYHNENEKNRTMVLTLANQAIATSGDLYQHLKINGKKYSHIINPKTGLGLTHQATVTIIAPNGTMADSYASAISVLGPLQGMRFLNKSTTLAGFIEYTKQGQLKQLSSEKFKALPKKNYSKERSQESH